MTCTVDVLFGGFPGSKVKIRSLFLVKWNKKLVLSKYEAFIINIMFVILNKVYNFLLSSFLHLSFTQNLQINKKKTVAEKTFDTNNDALFKTNINPFSPQYFTFLLISLRWWIAKLAYAFSDSIWIVNVSSSILLFPESGQYLSHLIWNKMHMIWLNYNRTYAWCHSYFESFWKGSYFRKL